MSKYQYEPRLRDRARKFIGALKADGIEATIAEDSIREYSIKVSVFARGQDYGLAVIYYSPKTDTFSMKSHELKDNSIAPRLEACWKEERTRSARSGLSYEIYVDGSYINGATGYGAVILENGKVVEELSGPVDSTEVNGTRQIAGELAAVKAALNWCAAHSVNEVSIYFDYLGIEKWATGQWKTNQSLTKEYARFVGQSGIKIHWHKVASHTGDRWNDRADALAKQGAGFNAQTDDRSDFVSDLIKKSEDWIDFLMVRGIEASLDRVYNEQFARVYLVQGDKPVGTFDLYNTKKKPFSPYIHNFRSDALKDKVERLWREFCGKTA
jgi:ribonuclease H-related protein